MSFTFNQPIFKTIFHVLKIAAAWQKHFFATLHESPEADWRFRVFRQNVEKIRYMQCKGLLQETQVIDDLSVLCLRGDLGIGTVSHQFVHCALDCVAQSLIAGAERDAVLLKAQILI